MSSLCNHPLGTTLTLLYLLQLSVCAGTWSQKAHLCRGELGSEPASRGICLGAAGVPCWRRQFSQRRQGLCPVEYAHGSHTFPLAEQHEEGTGATQQWAGTQALPRTGCVMLLYSLVPMQLNFLHPHIGTTRWTCFPECL